MYTILASLGVVLAAVLVGLGLAGFKYYQFTQMAQQGPPPETPTSVELSMAQAIAIRSKSVSVGTVLAPQSIVLSNEVPGTVSSVNLSPGTIVEAGTTLVELDCSIEKAQLDAANAELKMVQSRYVRVREAQRARALTELELEEAEGQLAQATARVAELAAIIQRKTLVAPFRARVGLSNTHLGQYLPSGTEITTLQGVDDFLFVDFSLPQHVAESVHVGEQVAYEFGDEKLAGVIVALDSRADRLSRNLQVRARLDGAPESLKPGNSLKVEVEFGPEIQAVAVPGEAVRRTPNGAQVFIAQEDAEGHLRASQRTVQILRSFGDQAIVASGISAGDQVVTAGSFKLLDGGLLQSGTRPESVNGHPVSLP